MEVTGTVEICRTRVRRGDLLPWHGTGSPRGFKQDVTRRVPVDSLVCIWTTLAEFSHSSLSWVPDNPKQVQNKSKNGHVSVLLAKTSYKRNRSGAFKASRYEVRSAKKRTIDRSSQSHLVMTIETIRYSESCMYLADA